MRKQILKKNDIDSKRVKLLIREGESLTVEFKEKYTSKIDEDIVAFSNTKGGFIFLGVSDN
ncbi:MAG: ATP-binding protein [Candidatus Methanoperedens sp.]|nr:ATP-binding protein [Candidatus Methanoperedens sp.]